MGAKLVVEEQRSEPNDYGKIKIRLDLKKAAWSAEKLREIENRVEDCLDALQEVATGSKVTVAGAAAGKDKPVKGQKKLSLDNAGAVVSTPSDQKQPGDFQVDPAPPPGETAAKGQRFTHPGAEKPVATPPPAEAFAPVP